MYCCVFIKCVKLLPPHFLFDHLSLVISSFFVCVGQNWRREVVVIVVVLFYCDMIWNFRTCNSCGDSLQSTSQTRSECTLSSRCSVLHSLSLSQRCVRICVNTLYWTFHWLKCSLNATNEDIYWISLSFYNFHRWVNEHKTPEQYLNKWMRPWNEKEANVCNVFNTATFVGTISTCSSFKQFPNLWTMPNNKKPYTYILI